MFFFSGRNSKVGEFYFCRSVESHNDDNNNVNSHTSNNNVIDNDDYVHTNVNANDDDVSDSAAAHAKHDADSNNVPSTYADNTDDCSDCTNADNTDDCSDADNCDASYAINACATANADKAAYTDWAAFANATRQQSDQ